MDVTVLATVLLSAGMVGQSNIGDSTTCRPAPVVVPGYTPWMHYHASTAAEGWLRGRADVIQSAGWYNYLTAQAMVYQQQAQAMAVENSTRATAAYFERRQINHDARFPRKAQSYSVQTAGMRPAKPARQLFDAATGKMAWPTAMMTAEFAAGRRKIEVLLQTPAALAGDAAAQRTADVRAVVAEMRAELEAQVRSMSPMEYVEAKQFLLALTGQSTSGKRPANDALATNP